VVNLDKKRRKQFFCCSWQTFAFAFTFGHSQKKKIVQRNFDVDTTKNLLLCS
jgi:hypothetical protein